MSPSPILESERSVHGDVLSAISDGMVALLKEFYGRGPTRAKISLTTTRYRALEHPPSPARATRPQLYQRRDRRYTW